MRIQLIRKFAQNLTARMVLLMNRFEALPGDVGINLSGGDISMP
jgi:hypothetical protein